LSISFVKGWAGSGRVAAKLADLGEHVFKQEPHVDRLDDTDGMSGAGQVVAFLAESGAGTTRKLPPRGYSINEMAGESPSERDSIGSGQ
jgi:hypothetical protein